MVKVDALLDLVNLKSPNQRSPRQRRGVASNFHGTNKFYSNFKWEFLLGGWDLWNEKIYYLMSASIRHTNDTE